MNMKFKINIKYKINVKYEMNMKYKMNKRWHIIQLQVWVGVHLITIGVGMISKWLKYKNKKSQYKIKKIRDHKIRKIKIWNIK